MLLFLCVGIGFPFRRFSWHSRCIVTFCHIVVWNSWSSVISTERSWFDRDAKIATRTNSNVSSKFNGKRGKMSKIHEYRLPPCLFRVYSALFYASTRLEVIKLYCWFSFLPAIIHVEFPDERKFTELLKHLIQSSGFSLVRWVLGTSVRSVFYNHPNRMWQCKRARVCVCGRLSSGKRHTHTGLWRKMLPVPKGNRFHSCHNHFGRCAHFRWQIL